MSYFYLRADFFEDAVLNPLFSLNQFVFTDSLGSDFSTSLIETAKSYVESLDLRRGGRSGSNGLSGGSIRLDGDSSTKMAVSGLISLNALKTCAAVRRPSFDNFIKLDELDTL